MSKKIMPQSKSFIILFLLAFFGSFLCLGLWLKITPGALPTATKQEAKQEPLNLTPAPPAQTGIDTSSWKKFSNTKYNFSFLYNPEWKVLTPKKKGDYTIIEIDPGKKYYNIKIYISTKNYYLMDGLPTTQETIGGQPAQNVNNMLYGVKFGDTYYTFDVGNSTSLVPDFDALVHSVEFVK